MQQQINQMMLQIAAGAFGGKHLKEQKKQTVEAKKQTKEQKKQTVEAKKQTKLAEKSKLDYDDHVVMSLYDSVYDITGAEEGSPLDTALTVAWENLNKRNTNKVIAKAQKEFAQKMAKGENLLATPAELLTPPTPPKSGGDK